MATWAWIMWLLLFAVMLYLVPARRSIAHAASVRRRVTQPKRDRLSLTLSSTDRLIRDQEHELYPDQPHKHLNCAICGPGPLQHGMVPSSYEHPFFRDDKRTRSDGYGSWSEDYLKPTLVEYAETVSSRVIEDGKFTGLHTVMLDLDMPVTLVESSTTGHHHLYIDKLVTWRQYKRLLRALVDCDLIEEDYYKASIGLGATHLRPPWVKKTPRLGGKVRSSKSMRVYWEKTVRADTWKRNRKLR